MNQEGSVEIDCPIEQVFKFTHEHVAEWSIVVVEDEVIESVNGGGVGTTFTNITEDHGKRMEFEGTVTKWDPPRHSEVSLVGDSFDIVAEYHFEDLGNGRTRVTQDSTVSGKGFFKIMFLLMGGMIKKQGCEAVNREMQSLKAFCESQ